MTVYIAVLTVLVVGFIVGQLLINRNLIRTQRANQQHLKTHDSAIRNLAEVMALVSGQQPPCQQTSEPSLVEPRGMQMILRHDGNSADRVTPLATLTRKGGRWQLSFGTSPFADGIPVPPSGETLTVIVRVVNAVGGIHASAEEVVAADQPLPSGQMLPKEPRGNG